MEFFKEWMFVPKPPPAPPQKQNFEEVRVEEIKKERGRKKRRIKKKREAKISSKEKMIVAFLRFLMLICGLSFAASVILLILSHSAAKEILVIFSSTLSSLIGYFLGTNKQQPA